MFKDTTADNEIIEHLEYLNEIEEKKDTKPYVYSKEDWLYLWCLALKYKLVGKLSPPTSRGEGSRQKVLYDCLVPDSVAVSELNARSDLPPISEKIWKSICKRYSAMEPPYSSFHK